MSTIIAVVPPLKYHDVPKVVADFLHALADEVDLFEDMDEFPWTCGDGNSLFLEFNRQHVAALLADGYHNRRLIESWLATLDWPEDQETIMVHVG